MTYETTKRRIRPHGYVVVFKDGQSEQTYWRRDVDERIECDPGGYGVAYVVRVYTGVNRLRKKGLNV